MDIHFYGDSFVQGIGVSQEKGWGGRVCENAVQSGSDVRFENYGVGGYTSVDVLAVWNRNDRASCNGDKFGSVFSFGTNDTGDGSFGISGVAVQKSMATAAGYDLLADLVRQWDHWWF